MPEPASATLSQSQRFAGPGDELARAFFTADDLALAPEEYIARHAHEWGCFSFHEYGYDDASLGAWVKRVGELLFADGEVERCRSQYLTPDELAAVRAREAEDF